MSARFDTFVEQDRFGTLPSFAAVRFMKDDMARQHVYIPDSVSVELEAALAATGMRKSQFIVRGIRMAIDDARNTFSEASNEPALVAPPLQVVESTPPPPPPPPPESSPIDEAVACIKRGDTVWFDMDAICYQLDISPRDLESRLDPEDDILPYAGKRWIDSRGADQAADLCSDPDVREGFTYWVFTKNA